MSKEISRMIDACAAGDRQAAADLLPLVYDELRKLASARMHAEPAGHTLDATALVHEAYLRVLGTNSESHWKGRSHFFAAAAEAMRRILVDSARRKKRIKHGGGRSRIPLDDVEAQIPEFKEDLLALDSALDKLKTVDGTAAELVQLRYFAGLSMSQAAESLDISIRSAERAWTYARAWLHQAIKDAQAGE